MIPKKYDYIYFYKNSDGVNVPVLTGGSSELNSIIWIRDKEKQAIINDFNITSDLFVWIDGTEFLIQQGEH